MKLNYAISVPEEVYVACSGGADSIAAALILQQWRKVKLLHFMHDDYVGHHERKFVEEFAKEFGFELFTKEQQTKTLNNREHSWRVARYEWFHSFDVPVVTGHTIDDALEWYLMTCLRGNGEYMTLRNKNVIRPFMFTEKQSLYGFLLDQGINWYDDLTNYDENFSVRNAVRSNLVTPALNIEPGLKNIIKRRIFERHHYERTDSTH